MQPAPANLGPRTWLILAIAAMTLVAGCAKSVPLRTQGPRVSGQGHASELVFAAPEIQAAGVVSGDEFHRRDAMLAMRTPITAFEQDAWPAARLPSLDRARRLWLRSTPDQVLYFPRERRTPEPVWYPYPWP